MGDLSLQVYGGSYGGSTYAYPTSASAASSATEAAYGSTANGGSTSWMDLLNPIQSPYGISILGAVLAVALLAFVRQSLPA